MERQLKQRLLGSIAIVSVVVIFLPTILDGEGYSYFSDRSNAKDTTSAPLSIIQRLPEPTVDESQMTVTREQIDAVGLSEAGSWFVHVDDRDSIDSASNLVRGLADGGYKATYRMIAESGEQVFKVEVSAGRSEVEGEAIAKSIKEKYGFKTTLIRR